MFSEIIKERALPPLRSRAEMLEILQKEEYGYMPPLPEGLTFSDGEEVYPRFGGNKGRYVRIVASGTLYGREFSFPFYAVIPNKGNKHPFVIHINFRGDMPDRFQPTEEIIDKGFAVFTLCHNDVTMDNDDFTHGLAGVIYPDGKRNSTDPGKIAIWAWAAQRVMDYAYTLGDMLDFNRAAVCGHSRLGKTALFCAATDERFTHCYSNDSGCGGASVARGNKGETVKNICETFHYWFCGEYKKYIDNEYNMPFDQHYLIASISPRRVMVGSASEDLWADPHNEQLSCVAASPAFPKGFIAPDRFAEVDDIFSEGDIAYHLREGTHYFNRTDWERFTEFLIPNS